MAIIRLKTDPFDMGRVIHSKCPAAVICNLPEYMHKNLRIYSDVADITCNKDALLSDIDATIVYEPQASITLAQWILIGITAASVAASIYMMNNLPEPEAERSPDDNKSSANSLSERGNDVRLGDRVEDIYGEVLTYPSFIQVPYRRWEDNVEVEYAYFCVGRGQYFVDSVYDGRSNLLSQTNSSAKVYPPFESPNNESDKHLVVDKTYPQEQVKLVYKNDEVDGQQELVSPDEQEQPTALEPTLYYDVNTKTARMTSENYSFTDYFSVGDIVNLNNFIIQDDVSHSQKILAEWYEDVDPDDRNTGVEVVYVDARLKFSIDGSYTVSRVDTTGLYFTVPDDIHSTWSKLSIHTSGYKPHQWRNKHGELVHCSELSGYSSWHYNGQELWSASNILTTSGEYDRLDGMDVVMSQYRPEPKYNKKFVMPEPEIPLVKDKSIGFEFYNEGGSDNIISFNVVSNALYKTKNSTGKDSTISVGFAAKVKRFDEQGSLLGEEVTHSYSISTNYDNRRAKVGVTCEFTLDCHRAVVNFVRTTDEYDDDTYQYQQQIFLDKLYQFVDVDESNFGDVTTIQTRREARPSTSKSSSDKLSVLCTRMLNTYDTDTHQWSDDKIATRDFVDIITAMHVDPIVGRRNLSELDIDNLKSVKSEIDTYFDAGDVFTRFDYVFDDSNTTYADTLDMIGTSILCNMYRTGSKIRAFFHRPQANSTMLFNHRNKIPSSDSYTRTLFDVDLKQYDSVKVSYKNPDNFDAIEYISVPNEGTNPKEIELIGVRNEQRAYVRAWREWLSIQHHKIQYETTVTAEGRKLIRGRRIDVVNDTIVDTLRSDGEFVEVLQGNFYMLSQDVELESDKSYVISINGLTDDGFSTYQTDIPVRQDDVSRGTNLVIIDSLPTNFNINTDITYVVSTYTINNVNDNIDSYIVSDMRVTDDNEIELSLTNYAEEIFDNDKSVAAQVKTWQI